MNSATPTMVVAATSPPAGRYGVTRVGGHDVQGCGSGRGVSVAAGAARGRPVPGRPGSAGPLQPGDAAAREVRTDRVRLDLLHRRAPAVLVVVGAGVDAAADHDGITDPEGRRDVLREL